MAQYTNVGGVARKVTKRYENIGGVAKNVLEAYNNVSGVARQYFAGGNPWRKWNCNYKAASDVWYVEGETESGHGVGYTWTVNWGGSGMYLSSDYSFDSSEGFIGINGSTVSFSDAVGYYDVDQTRVSLITNVTQVDSDSYVVTYEVVNVCQGYYYPSSYSKGTTDYGIVYVPEGQVPENGELKDGSVDGDYCAVYLDGTYYYYERV